MFQSWLQNVQSLSRPRTGYLVVSVLVLAYGLMALRGSQGVGALLEKHREIRQLEEQNAALAKENEIRRERIERLRTSPDEQQLEIRKQLKLQRRNETTFIIQQEGSKEPANKKTVPEPQ